MTITSRLTWFGCVRCVTGNVIRKGRVIANNYTQFSEMIEELTDSERSWLENIPDRGDFEDNPDIEEDWEKEFGAALIDYGLDIDGLDDTLDYFPSFEFKLESDGGWWIYAEEGGDLGHVGCIVQAFIKKFRPDFIFKLTWADYCSKLRLGEFGGGCLVVSKDEVVIRTAYGLADEIAEALRTGSFKA